TPGMSGSTGPRYCSLPARRLTSSTRLTVAAWILIRISPRRGCGSGTSSYLRTSGGPYSWITMAFMRVETPLELRAHQFIKDSSVSMSRPRGTFGAPRRVNLQCSLLRAHGRGRHGTRGAGPIHPQGREHDRREQDESKHGAGEERVVLHPQDHIEE